VVAKVDQSKFKRKFHVHNMMQVSAFQTDTVRNQSSSLGPVTGRQIDRWA